MQKLEGIGKGIRQPFALLLCAAWLLSLSPGCGKVAEPLHEDRPHILQDGFQNTDRAFAPPSLWERIMFVPARTWQTTFHTRTADLPFVENDGSALKNNRTEATVTWVGHSTLLIQLDGVTILTDPQWSERASPVTFAGPKRLMPPGLPFERLPAVDLVLISHDHYDHLDVDTVQRLARTHHPLFLVRLD